MLLLLLQYRRYGKETSSRVLGAVNHVDKVKHFQLLSFQRDAPPWTCARSPCSCTALWTSASSWWVWRSGRTETTSALTPNQRPLWTTSWRGVDPTSCRGRSTTTLSSWREDQPNVRPVQLKLRAHAGSSLPQRHNLWRRHRGTRQQVRHVHRELRGRQPGGRAAAAALNELGFVFGRFKRQNFLSPSGSPRKPAGPRLHHRSRDGPQLWALPWCRGVRVRPGVQQQLCDDRTAPVRRLWGVTRAARDERKSFFRSWRFECVGVCVCMCVKL